MNSSRSATVERPIERIAIDDYLVAGIEQFMTPALAIYPAHVEHNIHATLRLVGADANRWRPCRQLRVDFKMGRQPCGRVH